MPRKTKTKQYRVVITVLSREEFTEDEISNRIEFAGFDPFIEVQDCHVEEAADESEPL